MAKKKATSKQGAGRPKTNIDWDNIADMLQCQTPIEAIAIIYGVDRTTLYRRCQEDNNMNFTTFTQQNKMKGVERLRSKQFQTAMEGSVPMQIWLGKQLLGQKEKQDITTNDKDINTASRVVFDFTGEESDDAEESEVSDESEVEED